MLPPNYTSASPTFMSRRSLLAGLAVCTLGLDGCRRSSSTAKQQFSVSYDGRSVRCLVHERLAGGGGTSVLAIVLIHGAGADATQWFDIGLIDAIEGLDLNRSLDRVVAVAPDIADHHTAFDLIAGPLLDAVDARFAPSHHSVSGISRGAASVLDVGRRGDVADLVSVGLHSPAIRLTDPIETDSWRCWIDVGDADSLTDDTKTTADTLRRSGLDVTEQHWPGGHDRAYWRRHLPEYLAFHVASVDRLSS